MSGIRPHTFCGNDQTAQNIHQTEENIILVINFDVYMYEQPILLSSVKNNSLSLSLSLSLSIYSYFHK
jgi:hypothetical protein